MQNYIDQFQGKNIQFTKKIEDYECYAENGMRAKITSITQTDFSDDESGQVFVVGLDFTEYDEFNKRFESSNYYDRNGQPTLNAREAGLYSVQDKLYMGGGDWNKYFNVLDDNVNEVYNMFKLANTEMTYVEWLEDMVFTLT